MLEVFPFLFTNITLLTLCMLIINTHTMIENERVNIAHNSNKINSITNNHKDQRLNKFDQMYTEKEKKLGK